MDTNMRRGGARPRAGRKISDAWLESMSVELDMNLPALLGQVIRFAESHETGFRLWMNGQREKARPVSAGPRLVVRKPR